MSDAAGKAPPTSPNTTTDGNKCNCPAADLKTRTFEVEMTIDEPKGLKPGMVVTILLDSLGWWRMPG